MYLKYFAFPVLYLGLLISTSSQKFTEEVSENISSSIIARGQMPNLVTDNTGNVQLVYGNGDSIMYIELRNRGMSFSKPHYVASVQNLFASAMRGPQIAITKNGITILAADKTGNICSFRRSSSGNWEKTARVNDVEGVAWEGLMALDGDGDMLFAVWLDLRGDMHNKIAGAKSNDGGKTWSKNFLIYSSPDSSVCECCKPSVAIRGSNVSVMFRNWLHGNRDLYLIRSSDSGNHFGRIEKLGIGSWPLNGCPMDGGGLAVDTGGAIKTVWRRQNKIFSCIPGKPEVELGEGRNCAVTTMSNQTCYAWNENGEIVCLLPNGKKISPGKGSIPLIKLINGNGLICIWENEGWIRKAVFNL